MERRCDCKYALEPRNEESYDWICSVTGRSCAMNWITYHGQHLGPESKNCVIAYEKDHKEDKK